MIFISGKDVRDLQKQLLKENREIELICYRVNCTRIKIFIHSTSFIPRSDGTRIIARWSADSFLTSRVQTGCTVYIRRPSTAL